MSNSGRPHKEARDKGNAAPLKLKAAAAQKGRCCWRVRGELPRPLAAAERQRRRHCWIWRGRKGSRTCGCTPGGHVRTRGFGSACAPRSEDSGMAGPERPFRAVTAGGEGGAHAAQRTRQYEGTEVRHPTDPLMVKTGQQGDNGKSTGGREIPCAAVT